MVIWSQFGCLATCLHLPLAAMSFNHVITICDLFCCFFPTKNIHSEKWVCITTSVCSTTTDLFKNHGDSQQHYKNDCKIRSRLQCFGHKSRITCIANLSEHIGKNTISSILCVIQSKYTKIIITILISS